MGAGLKRAGTAGVALLGAGVIAVAPIEPAFAATPVIDASVQLSAIPSPLELYPQVFFRTVENTAKLVEAYLADPLPLTRLTIEKQIASAGDALAALRVGDGAAAGAAVGRVIIEPVRTVLGAVEYFAVQMNQPNAAAALFQIALSPILGGFAAFTVAIGDVVDAAVALDPVALLNAIINIPARVLDGALNGGYGSPFGNFDNLPGLVTPLTVEGYLAPGPIALAIQIDQDAARHLADAPEPAFSARAQSAVAQGVSSTTEATRDGVIDKPANDKPANDTGVTSVGEALNTGEVAEAVATDRETGNDFDSDTDTDFDTDSDFETDFETDGDFETDSDTDSDTDTDSAPTEGGTGAAAAQTSGADGADRTGTQ